MVTSTQITEKINKSPNPEETKFKLWQATRYLVAQKPAVAGYSETKIGYYMGRAVIPGPKANPNLSETLNEHDLSILENQFFIRFMDNKTTDNASDSIKEGLYTIMTKNEADDYEFHLTQQQNVDKEPSGPRSETT